MTDATEAPDMSEAPEPKNTVTVVPDGPLHALNFETLIATKASRVAEAAMGGGVLEFGMRRAHGLGANGATRASLIGGATGSEPVAITQVLAE